MFWVTSDTHFGHRNIFLDGYCPNRQKWMVAPTVEAHDKALKDMWNAIVKPSDVVIHCGDFAFGNMARIITYRLDLNGTIWLARGNHDRSLKSMTYCFDKERGDVVANGLILMIDHEKTIVVRHMPLVSEPGIQTDFAFTAEEADYADELWHGHVHDRPVLPMTPKHRAWGIDIGPRFTAIDRPVTLIETL